MVFLTDLCVLLSVWITTVRSSSATATAIETQTPTAPSLKIPVVSTSFQLDPPTPPLRNIPFVASPVLGETDPTPCKECESLPCQCEDLGVEEKNSAEEDSISEDLDYVPDN